MKSIIQSMFQSKNYLKNMELKKKSLLRLHIMIIVNSIISSFSIEGIYKEWTLIGLYSVTIYFTILLGIYFEILVVYIILKFLRIQNVKYSTLKKQLMTTIYYIYI